MAPEPNITVSKQQIEAIVLDVINQQEDIMNNSTVSSMITQSISMFNEHLQQQEIDHPMASKDHVRSMFEQFKIDKPTVSYSRVLDMIAESSNSIRNDTHLQITNIRQEFSTSCGLLNDSIRMLSDQIKINDEQLRATSDNNAAIAHTLASIQINSYCSDNRTKSCSLIQKSAPSPAIKRSTKLGAKTT